MSARRRRLLVLPALAAALLSASVAAGHVAGPPHAATVAARPPIVQWPIPFGAARNRDMAAYSKRHYGTSTYRLVHPHVIVIHYTVNDSLAATFNTFAPNVPDVELHEKPGLCSHFAVGPTGRIVQFVPIAIRCRHTVGLNWTALGIEHVGRSDSDVLGNPRELRASLRLTSWLRCREHIAIRNVMP